MSKHLITTPFITYSHWLLHGRAAYESFVWVPLISIPTITPAPQTPQTAPDMMCPDFLVLEMVSTSASRTTPRFTVKGLANRNSTWGVTQCRLFHLPVELPMGKASCMVQVVKLGSQL